MGRRRFAGKRQRAGNEGPGVNGIETAIRNALDKSDRSDPDARARIYRSARNAVDVGLRKQGVTDPQVIAAQYDYLEKLIDTIEAGERNAAVVETVAPAEAGRLDLAPGAARPAPASVAAPSLDMPADPLRAAPGAGDLGSLGAERPGSRRSAPRRDRIEPAIEAPPAAAMPLQAEPSLPPESREKPKKIKPETKRKRRGAGLFASLLIYGLLLAALAGGGWWLSQSGLIDQARALMDGTAAPPRPVTPPTDGSQFRGLRTLDPRNGFGDDWLEVLTPKQPERVKGGAAEAVSTNEGPAIRVLSKGGEDAAIEIPVSALQQMAGKSSTIALTLQSSANTPVQIAVECGFGTLGGCGRHRFDVTHDKNDILLHVVFDRGATPDAPGRLLIDPDLSAKGGGIDLFAVRILPEQ